MEIDRVKHILSLLSFFALVQCSPAPAPVATEEPALEPQPEPVASVSTTEKVAPSSSGSLTFEAEVYSAKAKADDDEVAASFVAENKTSAPITITKLDTSCSCLSVEADPMVVPPGGKTTISAVFEVAKLVGNAEKQVIVHTDSTDTPKQFLTVKVTVPPILEITPKMVEWSVGDPVEPKAVTFKVLRKKPIKITEITPSTRNATVELKTIEEGRHYEIIITPNATDQSRTGMVRIQTDCEMEKHQRQMAFFSVSPPVRDVTK